MKNAFLIFLSVFMSGCAVIDSACLETADIVEPGRVSLGLEMSIGPDLESAAQLADESFDDDRVVGGWIVPAFKLGFGIDESSDFNIKMWATYNGTGGRIYYKSPLINLSIFHSSDFHQFFFKLTNGAVRFLKFYQIQPNYC